MRIRDLGEKQAHVDVIHQHEEDRQTSEEVYAVVSRPGVLYLDQHDGGSSLECGVGLVQGHWLWLCDWR